MSLQLEDPHYESVHALHLSEEIGRNSLIWNQAL